MEYALKSDPLSGWGYSELLWAQEKKNAKPEFSYLVLGCVAEGGRFLGLESSLRPGKMHPRPGYRAEMHYPATPEMAPRFLRASLAVASSVTPLDWEAASFGGLMKKRSIIYCRQEVSGRVGRRPIVPMPELCRRLQRWIVGYVAAGIDAIGPAGCGSSEEAGSTFVTRLASYKAEREY